MVYIAVLGYGVVGSGVVELIGKNSKSISARSGEEIVVKKVLDIRDFEDCSDKHLLTKNAEDVFEDAEISIIIETIGGAGIAYEFTKRAFSNRKNVVTSNKELVAKHGPELLKMAKDNGVSYLFEASVGGGIPIIRPLNQCLSANVIDGVMGILNGTTNYILSQMRREGKDFSVALKSAQLNGYAEANPTADIEGHDACRKIAILSSIAYNQYVDYNNIYTEGISNISIADMEYAEAMDMVIKLVGMSRRQGDAITARVSPLMLEKSHPLANVEDVFNAIVVSGDALGDAMFYGRGAGKLPTASAVVADIIDIVKHIDSNSNNEWKILDHNNVLDYNESIVSLFVRINVKNIEAARIKVTECFGEVEFIMLDKSGIKDEIAFKTSPGKEGILRKKLECLDKEASITAIVNIVRVHVE